MIRRLFLAAPINPDDRFLHQHKTLQKALEEHRIKWVKTENLHLTLKFFGETDDSSLPAIIGALEEPIKAFPEFRISAGELGIFGSSYQPKVLWLGFEEGHEQLSELGNTVLNTLDKEGWPRDRQNFVPHLSFARIKQAKDLKHFQSVVDKYKGTFILQQNISSLLLYESILHPTGAEYNVLHSFSLKS